MSHNVIVTDLNRCMGCLACVVACKAQNDVPLGKYPQNVLRVGPTPKYEGAIPPDVQMYFLPVGCQHCANPQCVEVCPTGASFIREDGIVQINAETCIGCQICLDACPYGVRYLNEDLFVAEKCNLCSDRVDNGELPACVEQCGARARFFGDIDRGIENLEGPGDYVAIGEDKGYENCRASHVTLGAYVEPFEAGDVYKMNDSGNAPMFQYILRNHTWYERG